MNRFNRAYDSLNEIHDMLDERVLQEGQCTDGTGEDLRAMNDARDLLLDLECRVQDPEAIYREAWAAEQAAETGTQRNAWAVVASFALDELRRKQEGIARARKARKAVRSVGEETRVARRKVRKAMQCLRRAQRAVREQKRAFG